MASELIQELGKVVETARERWKIPGIAVGVLHDGHIEASGWGITSKDTHCPVAADTVFQIGSNSKVYTTTLLMSLVDEGRVDLDALAREYLPDLRLQDEQALEQIRVRHLVSHQSGIWGDYFDDFGWGDDALARSVAGIADLRQMYAPTTQWAYTNSGFNIAGLIIERVLGQSFEDAMRERVFESLGLERSFYFPHDVFAYPHAVGHRPEHPGDDDVIVAREFWLHRAVGPAGGIHAPVMDVLEFDRFHLGQLQPKEGKTVISDAARAAMQEPQIKAAGMSDEWGLGWSITHVDGVKTIGHGGGTNGFITRNTVVPEKGVAFATFTNSLYGGAAIRPIEQWLFAHVAGLQRSDPPLTTLSDTDLAEYAGRYTNPLSTFTVSVEDGALNVRTSSYNSMTNKTLEYPAVLYRPVGNDIFMATTGREEGVTIDFVRHPDGGLRFIRVGGRFALREA
jgi:CubicO group peptidase (beta-lactamase class C family)